VAFSSLIFEYFDIFLYNMFIPHFPTGRSRPPVFGRSEWDWERSWEQLCQILYPQIAVWIKVGGEVCLSHRIPASGEVSKLPQVCLLCGVLVAEC